MLGAKDLVRLCTVALGESLRPHADLKSVEMKLGRLHYGCEITPNEEAQNGWMLRDGNGGIRFLARDVRTAAIVLCCELIEQGLIKERSEQGADISLATRRQQHRARLHAAQPSLPFPSIMDSEGGIDRDRDEELN